MQLPAIIATLTIFNNILCYFGCFWAQWGYHLLKLLFSMWLFFELSLIITNLSAVFSFLLIYIYDISLNYILYTPVNIPFSPSLFLFSWILWISYLLLLPQMLPLPGYFSAFSALFQTRWTGFHRQLHKTRLKLHFCLLFCFHLFLYFISLLPPLILLLICKIAHGPVLT